MKDNREIKFRAWDRTGSYMSKPEEFHYTMSKEPIPASQVENMVFMQYIGLKDKNGKEIYEGDLVKVNWHSGFVGGDMETIGEVRFDYGCFIVDDKKRHDFPFYKHMAFEVIGNIYENPDLIK